MKDNYTRVNSLQVYRDEYINGINTAENKTSYAMMNSEALFNLGLTMYSKTFSFDSAVYNAFSESSLDESISLHPEQLKILNIIKSNKGTIFSAPTSFGKTFVVFEYIARYKPHNVILIVPTLALIDEYKRKIIKQYKESFIDYKIYLTVNPDVEYDFTKKNIFIVTHDRVVNENICNIFGKIDLLVIDEVYKLQKDENNDRVLILNMAYYNMVRKCDKYVLLAPFIKGVHNLDRLDNIPVFYGTNFSPVVNKVIERTVIDDEDREIETLKILRELQNENTLVYFPTVYELNKFIEKTIVNDDNKNEEDIAVDYLNPVLADFVKWAEVEIHKEWSLLKAIKRGYLVHHGQLPLGIRLLQLDLFNGKNEDYKKLLCTATLLEGVNTEAKYIIITKPARGYKDGEFDAFDFYNLVGRTGRLYKHYLGIAYYIKGPNDRDYVKADALKSIEFELTTDSIDIDINCNQYAKHPEFIEFLSTLDIDYDTYKKEIASKCRFSTVLYLYGNYKMNRMSLIEELKRQNENDSISKLELIRHFFDIIADTNYRRDKKLKTFIINKLTYLSKPRPTINKAVTESLKYFSYKSINEIISIALNIKNSYIEYDFYTRISIIKFFMECEKIDKPLINIIHTKLTRNIEILYYLNAPNKKMLKDIGIYEGDIDYIISIIGDDFTSVEELQFLIRKHYIKLNKVSIITKYVIENLV
jgi:hypothetical protein